MTEDELSKPLSSHEWTILGRAVDTMRGGVSFSGNFYSELSRLLSRVRYRAHKASEGVVLG